MLVTFDCLPNDHADACRQLEAICEGIVVAMVEEIDQWPEGTFPCCIKCGGFCTRNGPLTPAQAVAIQRTLSHGHPTASDRDELAGVLTDNGYYMPDDEPAPAERNQDTWAYEACVPEQYRQTAAPAPHAALHIRSARQILASKTGTTLELACYQCAQKRRHADPLARVMILCTAPGTFRGVVQCSQQHEKPERRGMIDDPVEDARPLGTCGCGITDDDHHHYGEDEVEG